MRAILIQHKFVEALKGEALMPAHLTPTEKTEIGISTGQKLERSSRLLNLVVL